MTTSKVIGSAKIFKTGAPQTKQTITKVFISDTLKNAANLNKPSIGVRLVVTYSATKQFNRVVNLTTATYNLTVVYPPGFPPAPPPLPTELVKKIAVTKQRTKVAHSKPSSTAII